jgi:hypothetical protein
VNGKAAGLALLLMLNAAAGGAGGAGGAPVRAPEQLLPLPAIAAAPVPAPMPPSVNSGVAAAPSDGLSPLLLQPGPAFVLPQPANPAYPPPSLPGPIDQQKISTYRSWLLGQQRLRQRGGNPDDYLGREIQQQLLQLEQPAGSP